MTRTKAQIEKALVATAGKPQRRKRRKPKIGKKKRTATTADILTRARAEMSAASASAPAPEAPKEEVPARDVVAELVDPVYVMDGKAVDGYVTTLTTEEIRAILSPQQLRTLQAKAAFLGEWSKRGIVLHAAAAAGVPRTAVYDWLESDEVFKKLYAEAKENAIDRMVEEARRRGVEGVLEPVYQGGVLVGHIRKYSDTLLLAMLRGLRPEVFRERHELTGAGGGPVALQPILVSYDINMKPPEEPDV